MDNLINFLSNNFDTIATNIISIVAILGFLGVVYQSKKQSEDKAMELYFEAQFNEYIKFYEIVSNLDRDLEEGEIRDIRELVAASTKVKLLSPYHVAEIIENFCAVYSDFLEESDNGRISEKTQKEFKTSLDLAIMYMREELLRYDYNRSRKHKRRRKQLEKIWIASNKGE